MRRSRFLIIASAAGVTACSGHAHALPGGGASPNPGNPNGDGVDNFGSIDDPTNYSLTGEALPPDAFTNSFLKTPPANVTTGGLLRVLPPVKDQGTAQNLGSPGSCSAQSYGYFLGTYTSALGTARNLTETSNQASAGWLYAYAHSLDGLACPHGTSGKPYLQQLVTAGSPSALDFAYDPDPARYDTTSKLCSYLGGANVGKVYGDESRFLIGSYKKFDTVTGMMGAYLPRFREFIDNGYPIAFYGNPGSGYFTPTLSSAGVYKSPAGTEPAALHSQVIVGYDDSLGAFLVQNSFGPGWNASGPAPGNNGLIWWDYADWFATQVGANVAYPNTAAPGNGGFPLTSTDTGGPAITIYSASTYTDSALGRYIVHFDLAASDAFELTNLEVVGPGGGTTAASYDEVIRTGYAFTQQTSGPFVTGTYGVTLSLNYQEDEYSYSGNVTVS